MSRQLADIERVLEVLRATPAQLAALAEGVSDEQLWKAPSAGEWSATEVLAHLCACADVWGDSVALITGEDRPTIRAVNPGSWIDSTNYPTLEFRPSLRAFTKQRVALMSLLDSLPPAGWSRTAIVTGAGAPLERTVHSYMDRMARHERPHIGQIARAIAGSVS